MSSRTCPLSTRPLLAHAGVEATGVVTPPHPTPLRTPHPPGHLPRADADLPVVHRCFLATSALPAGTWRA